MALQHHLTVFAISYRNPDSSMRDVSFEDYLFQGPRAAIDVARSITGATKVNTLSVCLGGTLNAALVAHLEAEGQDLVNSSTYLNTLVDFAGAGPSPTSSPTTRPSRPSSSRWNAGGTSRQVPWRTPSTCYGPMTLSLGTWRPTG